ncbi:hypothetical protein AN6763.2 [Aspergillus nidulans FGSC A4]|uniref:Fungal N-terminal domain-containing protein n=1 Tax=Emericella nidulans (strain FGSC A4 / ATCC 38163 / CBS 112.46 / NRRL 194 / M139) TaxID=227321 RepID=Q5AY67_EMENI|nr:hypothetical protein [Aspergillus nidulans FGSC A4]EAA58581.1 hypothetical protein AN6763.2 [Aspergillus nidulans FGSC A4]CBF71411.1 TPA: conserved hypothetical protein [Aspergillus nidulans FGSC A4]|eukprot:XP_664367.1 hypothetical protein AN6763.2 [Aspergillus nidulans FGSC A4]
MEAAAFAQAAAALASMFLEIVSTTKQVIETMKGARAALVELFTRAERIRLNLELFRSLTYRLSDPMERTAAISFNESSYRQTANEVLELVHKVADSGKRSDLMMRVNWLFYRSDVAALVKKLEDRERDLGLVLTFIAAQSSVVTEGEVHALRTKVDERTRISSASDTSPYGETTQPVDRVNEDPPEYEEFVQDTRPRAGWPEIVSPRPKQPPTLWPGVLLRESYPPEYLQKRDQLANAAYVGDWASVLDTLEKAKMLFQEPWANAVRLRTLPTGQTWGEFQYADLTPAEIAHVLGYDDIYGILAPVVRHVVPVRTQTYLQAKFNELLLSELEDCAQLPAGCIRFPPLSVLTELEHPEIWFPLGFLQKGFLFRLDGREVVVLSIGRRRGQPRQAFRVTTEGWTALEDVVVMS